MKPRTVRARVPATTSNLGPGFDVLGLALRLYNEVEISPLREPGALQVDIVGEGASTLPRDKTNLVVRTALNAAQKKIPRGLRFRLVNRIPLARGLGSSAAARLGGLAAMRAFLHGANVDQEASLRTACRLEGHPDNAAAAFFGGGYASLQSENRPFAVPLSIPRDLGAVVCVPDFELSTEKARAVLPQRVSRQEAVETSARVAILINALARRRYQDIRLAMTDVLHQPYRRRLVPGFDSVVAAALRAGAYGAALSGAGPSIFAFVPRGPKGTLIGNAMRRAWRAAGVDSRFLVLEIDRSGLQVRAK